MADVEEVEMKRSLTLTGVTVNAMALIAPGAFLWTTFQVQAAQTAGGKSTAGEMWTGLLFALVLAFLTAYSYSELARIYPDAGAGSSYYFAEAALLDKEKAQHRKLARAMKLTVGWISHLYYWIYPGIMVAFGGILLGYIYTTLTGKTLSYPVLAIVSILFALLCGYIAYRGISGSTTAAITVNVIQITTLIAFSIVAILFRLGHSNLGTYSQPSAIHVIIPHNLLYVLYQSTIAILLLVGFESVTALGAEALRPEKDIRRGILLSLLIQGGICYLFEYFSSNFAISTFTNPASGSGSSAIAGGYPSAGASGAPIGDMLTNIGNRMLGNTGQTLAMIMAATVLLALIGTTLACLNTGVRITYVMGRDKEMPGILGLLHGKYATPHGGIWILTALSAVLGIYGVHNVDNLTQITLASNIGTFLVYGITCLIAIIAFASRHDKHILKHFFVPGLGLLMNIFELLGVVYLSIKAGGTTQTDTVKAIVVVILWIVLGLIWVLANPRMRGTKLFHEPPPSEGKLAIPKPAEAIVPEPEVPAEAPAEA
jgi:APA family basic amino acid/polyamine antiporter